jgi:hypothetical protein
VLLYARAAEGEGGAGEEERRRDEVTGERAKEVAWAADGKATGAWVVVGRGGRRHAMEGGCDGKALRCGTWYGGKTSTCRTGIVIRGLSLRTGTSSMATLCAIMGIL